MKTQYFSKSSGNSKFNLLLILAGDKSYRKGLTVALMDYFYQIIVTDDPREAITITGRQKPEIIITEPDFEMFEGVEVIKSILQKSPRTSLYVITADIKQSGCDRLLKAGAKRILSKPFDINIIRKDLESFI